ncbi:MAG TPA: beta-L-arabinofuranosidase domain-containing protein [Candidatus Acidoferrum sp.]|nr:beta-L-arabinofuranosidase domain-containing protein [Candidatus Acidoferrum sp.]
MKRRQSISRRKFCATTALSAAGAVRPGLFFFSRGAGSAAAGPLQEFGYGDVTIASELHEKQLRDSQAVLMQLSDDSLLKPLRLMAGQPAPGDELGGWYLYNPDYDFRKDDAGFAPAATFGQWISALARGYAISPSPAVREKVLRLNRLYAQTISGDFYDKNRFPTYCYDKLVLGLIDSQRYAGDPDAFAILKRTSDVALPHLPGKAIEHDTVWRPGKDESWTWDESYTLSENLFLAYQRGAGERYKTLGAQYLDDLYYDPLAEGRSNLEGRHAYSHVNSLSSAMQAYLTLGSKKHFRAAKNGFDFVAAQSFATGGWGPDETLHSPESDAVFASLSKTHNSFETPCGAYAHFKLTRYLLRVTRDARYGDSMERVMYNTILGAKPLDAEGRTFYYADCNFAGRKVYSNHRWPCCSGTYPQIAADYRISAYFRDPQGVYVNLYVPSTLKWADGSNKISLTQSGRYPYSPEIQLEFAMARKSEFAVNLRIPAWAHGAAISINGKRASLEALPGTFAMLRRQWQSGDRVELELPLTQRVESLNAAHQKIVALLSGPLVLFPIGEAIPPITRESLLAAKQSGAHWQAETSTGPLHFLPFTEIADEPYSTYLKL